MAMGSNPATEAPGRAVDRASPLPLWAQVREDLSTRLRVGEFDERFPTDHELVDTYDVSRQTVREAVRRLSDEGLLERERGRGTHVRKLEFEHTPGTLEGLFHQVQAQGGVQTSLVSERHIIKDSQIAKRLKLSARAELVHIRRLRLADGEPLAIDRSWLPARLARPLLDASLTHSGLYDELARVCGVRVSGGSERVRPVVPGAADRRALGIPSGIAAFAIERLVHSADVPVEWRQSLVRGDRYSLVLELSGRRGGQRPVPWAVEPSL